MRDGVKLFTIVYSPERDGRAVPDPAAAHTVRHRPVRPRTAIARHSGPPPIRTSSKRKASSSSTRTCAGSSGRKASSSSCGRTGPKKTGTETDESTRHLRHDRLAREERPEQQRPRRAVGHLVSGLPDGVGHDRRAPRAQGVVAAGAGDRHVPRRRLPSQRRVPADVHVQLAGGQRAAARGRHRRRAAAVRLRHAGRLPLLPRAGPVANINEKYFNYSVPTWNEYMEHPDYDEYWERQNPLKHSRNITHAVLNVAGWFDAEDFYGPLETYRDDRKAQPRPTTTRSSSVRGCTAAGRRCRATSLGDIRFGSATADLLPQQHRVAVLPSPPQGSGRAEPAGEAACSRPAATRGRRSTRGRRTRRRRRARSICRPDGELVVHAAGGDRRRFDSVS